MKNRVMNKAVQIICVICEIFLVTFSTYLLKFQDVQWNVYLLFCILGIFGLAIRFLKNDMGKIERLSCFLAIMFALSTVLSNITIFSKTIYDIPNTIAIKGLVGILLCAGSFFSAMGVFELVEKVCFFKIGTVVLDKKKRFFSFLCPFIVIFVIDFIILLLCKYPGTIDPDGLDVIRQVYGFKFKSNHHAYFYTLFIYGVVKLVKDMTLSVFVAMTIQIFFVATCFASCLSTIYIAGFSKKVYWTFLAVCALYPFYIDYSFYLTKDVAFAGCMVLACTFIYRIGNSIGCYPAFEYSMLFLALLGTGIFRSNGIAVIGCLLIFSLFAFLKNRKSIPIVLALSLIGAFSLKNFALPAMGVQQPDILESIGIPIQQMARVLSYCDDYSDEDEAILSRIVDLDIIREKYTPYWVDMIKGDIREGNMEYLLENRKEILGIYLRTAVKHPWEYVKAWIDSTHGYWSGRKSFSIDFDGITKYEFQFDSKVLCSSLNNAFNRYADLFKTHSVLDVFSCIGLFFWIGIVSLYKGIRLKNRCAIATAITYLSVFATLFVAAPNDAIFRYVFGPVCLVPFLICISFGKTNQIIV